MTFLLFLIKKIKLKQVILILHIVQISQVFYELYIMRIYLMIKIFLKKVKDCEEFFFFQ